LAIAASNAMSSRAIHKALLESMTLMGASALQVYLLRRLFERKPAYRVQVPER